MTLKIPPFKLLPDDPFGNDRLSRKPEIDNLTQRIIETQSSLVVAVDAPWGMGKTAFVQMWEAHLKQNNIPSLCFSAWETDFAVDPLVPFVGEIEKQFPEDKRDAFKKTAQEVASVVVAPAMQLLSESELGATTPEVGAGIAAIKMARAAIEKYGKNKSKIKKFKDALEELAAASPSKRLVIFVDELDRCRPDYAVKVLERIKHLFEVPGVVFVLAIDREQLCNSIKGVYGAALDANKYLGRFIDHNHVLQKPAPTLYWCTLLERLGADKLLREWDHKLGEKPMLATLLLLEQAYRLSLRDANQLVAHINLVLQALKDDSVIFPQLLAFLVVARVQAREKYLSYLSTNTGVSDMVDYWEEQLRIANIFSKDSEFISTAGDITGCLIAAKPEEAVAREHIHAYSQMMIHNEQIAEAGLTRDYVSSVISSIETYQREISPSMLNDLASKIALQDV